MLPESGFLFAQPKNEPHEHTGSKQAKSSLQKSKQLPGQLGRGEKNSPPTPLSSWGFYPLKMGGYQHGVQKDVVSPIGPCPVIYLYQSLSSRGLGAEMSRKSHGFFALLFL